MRQATVETLDRLRAEVRRLERTPLAEPPLPTHPAVQRLFPGGAMHAGAAYTVTNSTTLAMALLAGPARAGAWCGVVGLPAFGLGAARTLGLDLERLVHVPEPGALWAGVTASLVDALGVVLVRPTTPVGQQEAARLTARAREHGAGVICLGPAGCWPRSAAVLSVIGSAWSGVGAGHGHLRRRILTVRAEPRGARPRSVTMSLSADGLQAPAAAVGRLPESGDGAESSGLAQAVG